MELVWDQVGDRRFELGVNRGVLYLPDGDIVPWNGLASVTEKLGQSVVSYYQDGIKYMDAQVAGSYAGELEAFTYPDELDPYMGFDSFAPGVFLHNQRAKTFSMSYQTRVANDIEGTDYGYKIHLLYNVMASPSDFQSATLGEKMDPQTLKWDLSGTPQLLSGIKPTAHISLHSRSIDPELLEILEAELYGTDDSDPMLPPLVDLLTMVEDFYP